MSLTSLTSTPSSSGSSSSSSSTTVANPNSNLTASDFINLMVTELENQDPMQPTSSDQILTEMSQIGQLESSDQLQTSLTSMVMQNNIGNAGAMIGKQVSGLDDNNNQASGIVTAVTVQNSSVYLQLDSGDSLSMSNVTSVTLPTTSSTTASTPGTTTGATTAATTGTAAN